MHLSSGEHTCESFVKHINKERLKHKGQWIAFNGEVNGKKVLFKSFGLWIQKFDINGIYYGQSCEHTTVSSFKEYIEGSLLR